MTYAGAIAFETFAAAIALVLLALGVLGTIGRTDVWDQQIAPQLEKRLLPDVYAGVNETAQRVFAHDSIGLIAFAAALALWEVSRAVRACMNALTRIYEARETRPAWLRAMLSVGIAMVTIAALLAAILITIAWSGPTGAWHWPVAVVRWLGAIGLLALAFAVLVRLAPAEPRDTQWASVGAVLVVTGWIVESLVFRWYVTSVASFRSATGSLVVFISITTYFSIAAIVLLVGIELNELLRKDERGDLHGMLAFVRRR
jgi:YihY family inner membrane protein